MTGSINAEIEIDDGHLTGSLVYVDQRPFPKASIDVAWFDWTPSDRALASFALATDPGAKSWDELFALADQIEKVDPKLATVAPLRVRLGLLARLSGIKLDADLLLHLVGVSGWVGTDAQAINNGFLALHLNDEDAAERIVIGAKPLSGDGPRPANPADRPRWLGKVEGQTLRITRVERDVLLTWGEGVLESSIQARNHPERSAGGLIRGRLQADQTTLCAGVLWPERIPIYGPNRLPIEKNLDRATPCALAILYDPGPGSESDRLLAQSRSVRETVSRSDSFESAPRPLNYRIQTLR